jgi:hypothetical protein
MKKRLAASFAFLAISNAIAAADVPTACPSVEAIKSEPLTMPINLGVYFVYSMGQFDTDGSWFFGMGGFEAKSGAEAIDLANAMLPKVYGNPVPQQDDNGWACMYHVQGKNTDDFVAMATYAGGDGFQINHLRRFK